MTTAPSDKRQPAKGAPSARPSVNGDAHPRTEESRQAKAQHPLAGLDIVVLAPDEPDIAALMRELRRQRAQVRQEWPVPEPFPREADIVLSDVTPTLAERLPWLPGEAPLALVLLVGAKELPDHRALLNCASHGVISRPINVHGALAALVLARSMMLYEQRLRMRIAKLDENLRNIRNVERAKALLMRERNLSEDDAYRFLRRHAMERRVPVGAVAALVIDSFDLLG